MRDIVRVQNGTSIYNSSNLGGMKKSTNKLPIIICATAGILLGSFAFKVSIAGINKTDTNDSSKSGLSDALNNKSTNYEAIDKFNDILFNSFGIDRYNPITILTANYPYFKMYYNNEYQDYLVQTQIELEKKALEEKKIQEAKEKALEANAQIKENTETAENTSSESSANTFQEVSSSITYEGDEEDEEKVTDSVVTSGKVNIINQTNYKIDVNKLLAEPLNLPNKKGPQILIYHTHTTESYLKNLEQLTMKNVESRTTDSKYNVTRVGEALINNLKKYDINVLHDTTIHDKDYNSSYGNSLKTLTKYVDKYSSLKMTIDLHRDAISGQKLRVVKTINGKNAAQIMFVIGTDSKLPNSKWKENLKLALKIQARLNELYPGLVKPVYISKNRYNQHLTNGSVIIEIGGDGNTIDECVRSTEYLARAINDVLYKSK
ncbi:stage II sporulation protein P [Ruminiclostridium herbifermentans]|uniref:Stage II sporulation protein P n=1 Tax=Ruminiclostridium herbifermentans TaxID=2488810 RepID=A0A4U7JBR5_9FIRM|nr:stage II sporulation protein P [Ruminiclostridium herbifermentans]QNU65567.1 stage II sporulation protein P [Ruminiclostridium herbifermentans]